MSGEKSDAAKGDRLRIKEFQNFWYKVQENLLMLRHTTSDGTVAVKVNTAATNQEILKDMYLFDPSHPYKIAWDIVVGVFILYSVFVVPFKIGFQAKSEPWEAYFDAVLVCLFAADIVVNFNTAFVDTKTEKLVTNRQEISSNYLKFWFWVDAVSTIPFELVTSSVSTSSLRLVKVLRLFRLMKLVRIMKFTKFAARLGELDLNPSALKLLTLMIQILFIAHLISCGWFYITLQNESLTQAHVPTADLPTTWATEANMVYASSFDKYVHAFYWTITTMLSIGYGDIIPTNMAERMFAMTVMMVGGALFGAVIAQVTKFIENRNPQAKEFKNSMDELKAYLREGKSLDETSPLLRKQIVRAYGYYLTRKSTFVETGMFSGLPRENLIELVFAIFDKEVRQVPGLADFCSRSAISYLLLHMQPFNAFGGDIIFQQYDVAEEMVLVATGSVTLMHESGLGANKKKVCIGIADDGDYFGEMEYLKNSCRMTTFCAEISCSLLSIGYQHLDKLEEDHTEAYDKFMETVEFRYEAFVRSKNVDRSELLEDGLEHPLVVNGKFRDAGESQSSRRMKLLANESKYTIVVGETDTGKPITDDATVKDFVELLIIHPSFNWKVLWDVFIGVLLIWTVVIAPVQIAFLAVQNTYIEVFFTCAFFLDMCFNFRTAYFSDLAEAYVVEPADIAVHYSKTWLFCDVISTVPFEMIVSLFLHSAGSGLGATKLFKSARLLRIMKLVRVSKIRQYMIQLEEWFGISPAIFNIMTMYIGVFFIAHIIACVWWGLSSSIQGHNAWFDDVIITGSLRHADVAHQYFTSLYWTFTTLSTTGYGDITPVNSSEMIICVFVMMIGASVFGYIVANVSALMNQMDAKSSNVAEKLTETTEFLSEKNCPKAIMDKTLKHVKITLSQKSTYDEKGILARLPTRLRNELLMVQRQNVMSNISMFEFLRGNVSMAMYIFNLLDPIYFQNGQVIFREGDIAHDVFFITSGSVRSYRKKPKKLVTKLASPVIGSAPNRSYNNRSFGGAGMLGTAGNQSAGGSAGGSATGDFSGATSATRHHIRMKHDDDIHHKFHMNNDSEYLGELFKGSFIGHMALLHNKRHGATAVAVSEKNCSLYALSRADIGRTTRESAHVAMYLQEALAKAIRKQQDDVGRHLVKVRRAELLRDLQKVRLEELLVASKEAEQQAQKAKATSLTSNLSSGATKLKHRISLANLGAVAMFGITTPKHQAPSRATFSVGGVSGAPTSQNPIAGRTAESTAYPSGFSVTQFTKLAAIPDPHLEDSGSSIVSSPRHDEESPEGLGAGATMTVGVNMQHPAMISETASDIDLGTLCKTAGSVGSEDGAKMSLNMEESTISQEVKEKVNEEEPKTGTSKLAALLQGTAGARISPMSPLPAAGAGMGTGTGSWTDTETGTGTGVGAGVGAEHEGTAGSANSMERVAPLHRLESSVSFNSLSKSAKADRLLGRDPLSRLSNRNLHFDVFKQMVASEDTAFLERRNKHLIKLKRFPSCPEFSALCSKMEWQEIDVTAENLMAVVHAGDLYAEHEQETPPNGLANGVSEESDDDTISIARPLRRSSSMSVKLQTVSNGAGGGDKGLKEAIAYARATGASTAAAAIRKLKANSSAANSCDVSVSEQSELSPSESPNPAPSRSALMTRRMSSKNSIREDEMSEIAMTSVLGNSNRTGEHHESDTSAAPLMELGKRGRSARRLLRSSIDHTNASTDSADCDVKSEQVIRMFSDNSPARKSISGSSTGSRHSPSHLDMVFSMSGSAGVARKISSSRPNLPPIEAGVNSMNRHNDSDVLAKVGNASGKTKEQEVVARKTVSHRQRRYSWPSLSADCMGNVCVELHESSHPLV